MAVVPFPNLAPQGQNPGIEWTLRSITARHQSPLSGVATTLERPGAHWAARLPYENLPIARRAPLQAFAASCRGHANRFHLPVFGWTRRGSFPATELFPNTAFTTTTGLTPSSQTTLSVSDNLLRARRTGVVSNQFTARASSAVTVTQYAPYALRFIAHQGRGAYASGLTAYDDTLGARIGSTVTSFGRVDGLVVPSGTTSTPALLDEATTTLIAGDYFSISFASFARCALVDNAPNLLLRSDEFDNASWSKVASSVTANTATNPIGTNTGETLIEDGTSAFHYVQQTATVSSSAADYTFGVAIKAGTRNFAWVEMSDGTHTVIVYVNLANGALGTPTSGGANFTLPRASTVDLGNGWHAVYLTGRKNSSSTSIICRVGLATSISTGNYAGDGASFIAIWRGTLAQSAFPTRLAQTTTASTSGTSQTGGALYLKGLPASTDGLLLQGDPAEIAIGTTTQLVRTRSSLNSDAAGLGYWQFEPPLRVSPSDGAAVIIHNPLCKMMLDANDVGWTDRASEISDLEFAAVEDTYPS